MQRRPQVSKEDLLECRFSCSGGAVLPDLKINNDSGLAMGIALEQKSVTLLFLGVMLAERGEGLAVGRP